MLYFYLSPITNLLSFTVPCVHIFIASTHYIALPCAQGENCIVLTQSPVCMFHTLTVLSSEPLHKCPLCSSKQKIQSVCPLYVCCTSPAALHSSISSNNPTNRDDDPPQRVLT